MTFSQMPVSCGRTGHDRSRQEEKNAVCRQNTVGLLYGENISNPRFLVPGVVVTEEHVIVGVERVGVYLVHAIVRRECSCLLRWSR